MSTKVVEPGQIFIHPGTLKATGTLIADGGPPGQAGGTIEVQTSGTNDGSIFLQGGKSGGGFGASLIVDSGATGTNMGKVGVGGGFGGQVAGQAGGTGAALTVDGTVTNDGSIILQTGGLGLHGGGIGSGGSLVDNGSLTNSGVINIQGFGGTAGAVSVSSTGVLTDTGSVLGTGALFNDGLVIGAASGQPSGLIGVAVENDGTIESSGKLTIVGAITGSGAIDVSTGGNLALDQQVAASQTVTFDGATGELDLADPAAFLASIDGFSGSDKLNLTGLAYVSGATSATFAGGVLTVTDGASTDTFDLVGVADGTLFSVQQDAAGGTLVEETAQCFVVGTRIATPGGEVAVEDLRIGDLVTTLHGAAKPIKWIGCRGYEGRFIAGNHLMLPVCIKADALGANMPKRDLRVSAGHALYIDGVLVPAWRLVNGVSVTQPATVESVSYLHIELDEHDVVLAEGMPAETYLDEQSRGQFANAAEFARLYPQAVVAAAPCAPRVDDGFVLEAIIRRIAARAFIEQTVNPPGQMRGYLEVAGPDRLVGWAQDEDNAEIPVALEVIADGRRVLRLLANRYRADVRGEGLGKGCHGFDLALPAGTVTAGMGVVVQRASDGAVLPESGARFHMPKVAQG